MRTKKKNVSSVCHSFFIFIILNYNYWVIFVSRGQWRRIGRRKWLSKSLQLVVDSFSPSCAINVFLTAVFKLKDEFAIRMSRRIGRGRQGRIRCYWIGGFCSIKVHLSIPQEILQKAFWLERKRRPSSRISMISDFIRWRCRWWRCLKLMRNHFILNLNVIKFKKS